MSCEILRRTGVIVFSVILPVPPSSVTLLNRQSLWENIIRFPPQYSNTRDTKYLSSRTQLCAITWNVTFFFFFFFFLLLFLFLTPFLPWGRLSSRCWREASPCLHRPSGLPLFSARCAVPYRATTCCTAPTTTTPGWGMAVWLLVRRMFLFYFFIINVLRTLLGLYLGKTERERK